MSWGSFLFYNINYMRNKTKIYVFPFGCVWSPLLLCSCFSTSSCFLCFLKTTWWTRLKFLYVDKSSGFLIISCSPTDDVFYQLEMIKNGFYRLPLPLKVTFQHSSSWEGRRAVRAVRRVKMSTAGTSSRRWTQPILQFLSIPTSF